MLKIAITGANGFIGSRLVELFHLTGVAQIVPIGRSFASLARLARFDLEHKIADGCDQYSLMKAFSGCDVVVDAMLIDPVNMPTSAEAVYIAANEAGVKRLVYLSSSAVHGQSPRPGSDETTPLSLIQPFPYNTAKVKAERNLLRCRNHGSTELVVLRPGIVIGPRSRWISTLADQLLSRSAYLINGGDGICNSIYIDNLIEAIHLAAITSNIDGQTFIVGDEENVRWLDLYSSIAQALAIDTSTIHQITAQTRMLQPLNLGEKVRTSSTAQAILPFVPGRLKRAAKAAIKEMRRTESPAQLQSLAPQVVIQPSAEMTLLQECKYKLPDVKARSMLNYKSTISFTEGCRRSIGWLSFAGYPVINP